MKRTPMIIALAGLMMTGCTATSPPHRPGDPHRQSERPVTHVEELMRFYPGVALLRRGNGFEIRIRGEHREPLYVLDGLPLMPQPGGTLLSINPSDIARIEVLTDPVDLALYGGSRGGAGVVLITTKRGR